MLTHSLTRRASIFCLLYCLLGTNTACAAPNIIFILVDDQGYYDLGCYGATEVETPHIDKMAKEGTRFTDYYAAAPICSPSRAGLLTGCYPRRIGNHIWVHRADSQSGIHPNELTLAELFQENGYATACIGKWHLGFREPFLPHNQGFDHYFGLLHNLDPVEVVYFKDRGGVPLIRNGDVVKRPADPSELTKLYTDEAIDFIKKQQKESSKAPFFLYLPHTMLHNPLGVSEAFRGKSKWGEYGDAIQELDHHVGRIFDTLEELEIADNTIVIYASDNGRGPGRTPDQPIRGRKLSTFEGGIRVPAIAWGPGVGLQSGINSSAVVRAMDWYPTLASFAKIEIPRDRVIDGRDISELLTNPSAAAVAPAAEVAPPGESVMRNASVPFRRRWDPPGEWESLITRNEYNDAFFYHGSQGALAAVRWKNWKLVLNPTLQLYDLEKDPGETQVERNREITRKLRGMAILFQEEMRLDARPGGDVYLEEQKMRASWTSLFNGKDLDGWRANVSPKSFSVVDGTIRVQAVGDTSAHLFYVGEKESGFESFTNFELEATVRAEPNSNSGIFVHTSKETRNKQLHLAKGYEIQLNSTVKEKRKTGSLYAIVDLPESPVDETKWFHLNVLVAGKRITISINGKRVVDYTEPADAVRPKNREGRRFSANGGAIALQAHDPNSVWYFKDIRVKRFPEKSDAVPLNVQGQMKPYDESIEGVASKIRMVPIPGGNFRMGSPEDEPHRTQDEGPQHEVFISPFWMASTETTWEFYDAWVYQKEIRKRKKLPTDKSGSKLSQPTMPEMPNDFGMERVGRPAVNMTNYAASEFCKWFSEKTGKHYRLPTEAEWEYACRAGATTTYSWGDDETEMDKYAWYYGNSPDSYQRVGQLKPNRWGLHDMHGNVSEWVRDQFSAAGYDVDKLANKPRLNPLILPKSEYPRVYRGGCFEDDPENLRSAKRFQSSPKLKQQDPQIPTSKWWNTDGYFIGFRIVRPLEE